MRAYQYANIKNYLHGIAFKGRLAYAMWAGSVGTLQGQANLPVFAPQRLKQAGGGSKARIERLVDAMFLENVCRDERQLVNGLSEFRGHASRSNGHEANSGGGGRNLPRAIGRTGFVGLRLLMSAGKVHFLSRPVLQEFGYESKEREFECFWARP